MLGQPKDIQGLKRPGRFILIALPLMALFYAIVFAPHAADGVVVRMLSWYLARVAQVSGAVIGLFDASVMVNLHDIGGRFPLRIVLDCAALDAQCLFAAAVLAYPAPWRHRIVGVLAGCSAIAAVNIGRIVVLYFVGVHAPSAFNFMHEEVMQVAIVLLSLMIFVGWTLWIARAARPDVVAVF